MAKLSMSDVAGAFSKGPDPRDALKLESSLKGYNDFKKQLKEFDPELRKAMDREIRVVLKPLATRAATFVPDKPLSGWRMGSGRGADNGERKLPNWDASAVRKGIKVRQGGRRSRGNATQSAWKIVNMDGAGAAFELAGKKGGRTASGRYLVSGLRFYHGKASRLIWRAWDEADGERKVTNEVLGIVKLYESKLELGLKSAKD